MKSDHSKSLYIIRTLVVFVCIMYSTSSLSAQGNLQFNQVRNFTGNLSGIATGISSPIQVVPQGKVWKVEHVGGNGSNPGSSPRWGVLVNGSFSASFIGTYIDQNICPIWLKENDTLQFYYVNPQATNQSCSYVISVIEFNVVP
jgi:hypothetical protein